MVNIRVILIPKRVLMNFSYGKEKLTLKKVFEIAQGKRKGILIPEVIEGVQKSNAIVQQVIRSGKTVYGINTGFGPLCDTLISEDQTQTLQKNLLLTHAVGVGKPIDPLLAIFNAPRSLFTTRVAKASPSTSSAIISKGFPV